MRLLVGGRDQQADRKRRAPGLTFVEVSVVGGPCRSPLGGSVPPGMFGQVVAAHEAPVAHSAHKLLLTSVRAAVARQLVGAGELLIAALPKTAERLLTCMCAQVSLQVRAFEVGLFAAREAAYVVPPTGEVCLRDVAATAARWQVDGRRGEREELGVAKGDDSLRGVRRQHQHDGALWHG